MALEDAITKLTAAVEANTAAIAKLAAAGGKGAAPATATDKPADKPATTKPPKADKPAELTEEAFRKAFGDFLGVTDKALKDTRKQQVSAILAHFGVAKATEISADKRVEAVGYVKALLAGQTPEFMAEEAADDGDSLL